MIPERRRVQREKKHLHARQRFEERYGDELSVEDAEQIVHAIRTILATSVRRVVNQTRYVRQDSSRRTIWSTCVRGTEAFLVYDHRQRRIVTFLRPTWVRWQKSIRERRLLQ